MKSGIRGSASSIVNGIMNSTLAIEASGWEATLLESGYSSEEAKQQVDAMKLAFQKEFLDRFKKKYLASLQAKRASEQLEVQVTAVVSKTSQTVVASASATPSNASGVASQMPKKRI